jgi:hypothetical protein
MASVGVSVGKTGGAVGEAVGVSVDSATGAISVGVGSTVAVDSSPPRIGNAMVLGRETAIVPVNVPGDAMVEVIAGAPGSSVGVGVRV